MLKHKIIPSKTLTKNEEKSCAKATYYLKIRFRVGILNPSLFQITTPSPPIKMKEYFTSTIIILNEKRNILKRRENNHINQHFFIYFFGQGGVILYFI